MTVRWPSCLLGAALASMLGAGTRAAETVTPLQKNVLEQIIHDYILQHPELLSQALQSAADKSKAQTEQNNRASVIGKRQELLNDPMSLVVGNAKGDVTIVEFFDYRCGYCRQVEPVLKALLREDQGIRIIYKELPILGNDSRYATRVAFAAQKQARYEEFHAAMMAATGKIDEKAVLDVAGSTGLDVEKIKADMQAVEIEDSIERNLDLGRTLGIRGTPTFVIGDEIVFGAIDLATMRRKITATRGSSLRESGEAAGVTARPPAISRKDWRG
jgi:protein-disulfide isomerase